jgi:hypothetical protein
LTDEQWSEIVSRVMREQLEEEEAERLEEIDEHFFDDCSDDPD